jgi:type I restriction enzyme S subunit
VSEKKMIRLRELGVWCGGNTPSKARSDFWAGGVIPWVSPKDMKVQEITQSEDKISQIALQEGRVSLLPAGAVLVVTRSGILSHSLPVAVTKIPVTINQDLKALIPNEDVCPHYVAYALRGESQRILKSCSKHGTTVASVETTALLDFEIPWVPLDEQRRVVAEIEKQFSRLDEAIANLQRVKANLKRYKASVLKAAVEGRLVETEASIAQRECRSYETGEQLLQRILEERRAKWTGRGKWKVPESPTADTPLPDGWVWTCIDQLAEVGTGATPKRDKAVYWNDGDVPWVTSSVVNGDYVDAASEFVTKLALAETNLTLYPVGTLLLAMYGEGKTRGKCAELRIPATTNQALAALQVAAPVRGYVRQFLELNYEEMRKVASGGVQPNLNLSLVRAVCVPLPPLMEQIRIVAEVDRHLSIVRGVEVEVDTNLKRMQVLRQATLAKAFAEDM